MVRHKYICFLLLLLLPFFYPLWKIMSYTGFIFWKEPNDIIRHIWLQTKTLMHTKELKIKTWFGILLISAIAHIPYIITWKIIYAVWIVYIK